MQTPSRWSLALVYTPKLTIFALPIPTCWYLKTQTDPTRKPPRTKHEAPLVQRKPPWTQRKPNASPTQAQRKPNASRWNIGCVGSPYDGACVGHVYYMLFVSISFALGTQREPGFWWNMGLTMHFLVSNKQRLNAVY